MLLTESCTQSIDKNVYTSAQAKFAIFHMVTCRAKRPT